MKIVMPVSDMKILVGGEAMILIPAMDTAQGVMPEGESKTYFYTGESRVLEWCKGIAQCKPGSIP